MDIKHLIRELLIESVLQEWKGKLRSQYVSFEEFEHYDEMYGLSKRLGFNSAEEAWNADPIISGSTNPQDYRLIKENIKDPTKEEMVEFLKQQYGTEAEEFDVASAIYWFANDYHDGQHSNLYSALSTSPYKPGSAHTGVEADGEMAKMMYDDLVAKFAPGAGVESTVMESVVDQKSDVPDLVFSNGNPAKCGCVLNAWPPNYSVYFCETHKCGNVKIDESTPPGFPKQLSQKLLKQYSDEPSKAYATMWKLHNKHGSKLTEMIKSTTKKSV